MFNNSQTLFEVLLLQFLLFCVNTNHHKCHNCHTDRRHRLTWGRFTGAGSLFKCAFVGMIGSTGQAQESRW